ncbi:MAG: hypothetical protein Kow00108_01320 [Calditrichia bacterium]
MRNLIILYLLAALFVIGCSSDPKIFDVGDNGTFVTDTVRVGQVSEYYSNADTVYTANLSYLLLSNLTEFQSRLVFKLDMTNGEFDNKIITSVKINLRGAYFNGPDLDSLNCSVYPVKMEWVSNNDQNWQTLENMIDYSTPLGYLTLTDSVGGGDTLRITNQNVLSLWQDSSEVNYGFIVDLPQSVERVQKSYYSMNGDFNPEVVFTYLDSLNDPEEKSETSFSLIDMFVFTDQTNEYYNDPDYYYLENIFSNKLRFLVNLDSVKQFIDQNNASLISVRLAFPVDLSRSYYKSSSVLSYGIYPLADGWTPDSLAKQSEFTSGLSRAVLDEVDENGFLTFTDDFNTSVFTNNHITLTIKGDVPNNGWVLEPAQPLRGYQIFAVPKTSDNILMIINYWIPPEPRY